MRRRFALARLAGPISRWPGRIAVTALLVCVVGGSGFFHFGVDAGQSLLVGGSSDAGRTNQRFTQRFGGDPIVVVVQLHNAPALYIERNLQRLGAAETDLAHDPDVKSVLGPGTVAVSGSQAAQQEVTKTLQEYPFFLAETDLLGQEQKGVTDQAKLTQQFQRDFTTAQDVLGLSFVKAAQDADAARSHYQGVTKPGRDRIIDSEEQAAETAVDKDPLPPYFAEYLAGPGSKPDPAQARAVFDRLAAADGSCNDQIAALTNKAPVCQYFFERLLLDLPHCPAVDQHRFCDPKSQWAAVLPKPAGPRDTSKGVITIRVTAAAAADPTRVRALQTKVDRLFQHGIENDAYIRALPQSSRDQFTQLGPLLPSECGGDTDKTSACNRTYHDARADFTVAGAPLLALGVVNSMSHLLLALFPVVLLLMLALLIGTFRVRGRIWPLPAAVAAAAATVGCALWLGTPITPAVLAGIPVLIGLGVDYAVQLVARYSEERERGDDVEAALITTLTTTGPATAVAALATVAGVLTLAVIAGVDAGPLVAIPLVAEFALVLLGGVVLAWMAAVAIALPGAVWSDSRRSIRQTDEPDRGGAAGANGRAQPVSGWVSSPSPRSAAMMLLVTALAVGGWVALPHVPVQTDVEHLLAPGLTELRDVELVRAQTGYANEVDVFVEGQGVVGLGTGTNRSDSVLWQCSVAEAIRTTHPDVVAQSTSIADFFLATQSSSPTTATPARVCTSGPTSPSPTPGSSPPTPVPPSPSTAGAVPGTTPSPSARRDAATDATAAGRLIGPLAATAPPPDAASPGAPASPVPSAPASATAGAPPAATPSPTRSGSSPPAAVQTAFICDLRLFPLLSRTLVMDIGLGTTACPPVDRFRQTFIGTDTTPINPTASRIAIGVRSTSIADQARLIDDLDRTLAPPNGLSARPTGLAALAATAYDTLTSRALFLNLTPLVVVAVILLLIYREPRQALLPVLPTALAAGWGPLLLVVLGRLPGTRGSTVAELNPLTVVLGALVVALGTEFGVVLLRRFYEECAAGMEPEVAAGAALAGVGRAIRVSALTLGGGFAVLAISGVLPGGLPLVSDFGLVVVADLALAVAAVFMVMLPLAVGLERRSPMRQATVSSRPAGGLRQRSDRTSGGTPRAAGGRGGRAQGTTPNVVAAPRGVAVPDADAGEPTPASADGDPSDASAAGPRRTPGLSGRKRSGRSLSASAPEPAVSGPSRHVPGMTGRRRGGAGSALRSGGDRPGPGEADAPHAEPADEASSEVPPPRRRRRRPPPSAGRQRDDDPPPS